MILRRKHLECTVGGSDKLYNLVLTDDDWTQPRYKITAAYGRRGAVLKNVTKGTFFAFTYAEEAFEKLVLEKTKKGYTDAQVRTSNTQATANLKKKKSIQPEENEPVNFRRISFEL